MMGSKGGCAAVCCALIAWTGFAVAANAASRPSIKHESVPFFVQGQPLTVVARIKPGDARIKSVTLHYTASRDASPIKLLMTPAGGGRYAATVPADHLSSTASISYYIEAIDEADIWAETNWYEIRLNSSGVVKRLQSPTGSSYPDDVSRESENSSKILVGGGIAAAAIIGIAAVGGGGSGGSGSSENTTSGDGISQLPEPTCEDTDAVGTWIGLTDPVAAPGFALQSGNTGQFFTKIGGAPVAGSWTLIECDLTLIPPEDASSYRGTGILSDDRTTIEINGLTFRKGG